MKIPSLQNLEITTAISNFPLDIHWATISERLLICAQRKYHSECDWLIVKSCDVRNNLYRCVNNFSSFDRVFLKQYV